MKKDFSNLKQNQALKTIKMKIVKCYISVVLYSYSGELSITQLRGRLIAVDPSNLIQIILAEGKNKNE